MFTTFPLSRTYRQAASVTAWASAVVGGIIAATVARFMVVHAWRQEACGVAAHVPMLVVNMLQLAAAAKSWRFSGAIQAHTQAITAGVIFAR